MLKSLTAISLMSLSATVLMGVVGAIVMFMGARQILGRQTDAGRLFHVTRCSWLSGRRRCSRSSASERRLPRRSPGWTARARCWTSGRRIEDPRRAVTLGAIRGDVTFEDVTLRVRAGQAGAARRAVSMSQPGTVTALVGSSGSGKSTIISLICGVSQAERGQVLVDGVDLSTVRLDSYRTQLGVVLQDIVPVRRNDSRERGVRAAGCDRRSRFCEACRDRARG